MKTELVDRGASQARRRARSAVPPIAILVAKSLQSACATRTMVAQTRIHGAPDETCMTDELTTCMRPLGSEIVSRYETNTVAPLPAHHVAAQEVEPVAVVAPATGPSTSPAPTPAIVLRPHGRPPVGRPH